MENENTIDTWKDIDDFVNGLTSIHIDIIDKLINLKDDCQLPDGLYDAVKNDTAFEKDIEDYIRQILQRNDEQSAILKQKIISLTEEVYDYDADGRIDFTAGLYNHDDLYLRAIDYALKQKANRN